MKERFELSQRSKDGRVPHTFEVSGRVFDSFREAAEHGFPVRCEQFALCQNAATVALYNPVVGAVPTCDRCAERIDSLR